MEAVARAGPASPPSCTWLKLHSSAGVAAAQSLRIPSGTQPALGSACMARLGGIVRALLSRREDDSALHIRLTRPRTAKSS